MKKYVLSLSVLILLAGCGSKEESKSLDKDKAFDAVASKALDQKVIEDGGYKKEDISVIQACKAVKTGKEDYGFKGNYIVYWETNDSKYQRKFVMKNYKVDYGTSNFTELDEDCIKFNSK